jgi:hypothetical protein
VVNAKREIVGKTKEVVCTSRPILSKIQRFSHPLLLNLPVGAPSTNLDEARENIIDGGISRELGIVMASANLAQTH